MDPWVTLVIAGAAIAGYGWLKPEPKEQAASVVNEEAYDRLLEDLETENRELVDAVAAFKREQDDTVSRLGRRIRELERQMEESAAYRKADIYGRAEPAAANERFGPTRPEPAIYLPEAPDIRPPAGESAEGAGRAVRAADDLHAQAGSSAARASKEADAVPLRGHAADHAADNEASAVPDDGAADRPALIRDRYAQLLELYERGRSVEQVAKAMNMNKGEVQLILQLAKREANRP
ncbi:hypothetical protein [Cohnella rhizosphaerae]|uniref:Uncharacterized protein n=1 Tax=Cohnella rhizosphaerae TaxID=1457232 RepID=A0A9X4KX74_9BACL|nr:hypothetical protein [Cohnella rhizosphaerae]MDG0812448.1 hypothetical protein [Cohnella rhizosphaerae]